jgi:hypothetical protein
MFLAIETLNATAQWVIYLIALIIFGASAFGFEPGGRLRLLGLGLAFLTFPLFWNNLAAS